MEARTFVTPEDHDDDLAQVVARIRTKSRGLPLPAPSTDVVASVIAHLYNEEPLSDADLAEHERLWHTVQDEMRGRDQANERAEGLL